MTSTDKEKFMKRIILTNCMNNSKKLIEAKYNSNSEKLKINIINNIIYDEPLHLVSIFKEYLLWDETSDFLRRYYKFFETTSRIKKINDFYSNYFIITPNYYCLDEKKILDKNLKRKRKLLDSLNNIAEEDEDISKKRNSTIFKGSVIMKINDYTICLNNNSSFDKNFQSEKSFNQEELSSILFEEMKSSFISISKQMKNTKITNDNKKAQVLDENKSKFRKMNSKESKLKTPIKLMNQKPIINSNINKISIGTKSPGFRNTEKSNFKIEAPCKNQIGSQTTRDKLYQKKIILSRNNDIQRVLTPKTNSEFKSKKQKDNNSDNFRTHHKKINPNTIKLTESKKLIEKQRGNDRDKLNKNPLVKPNKSLLGMRKLSENNNFQKTDTSKSKIFLDKTYNYQNSITLKNRKIDDRKALTDRNNKENPLKEINENKLKYTPRAKGKDTTSLGVNIVKSKKDLNLKFRKISDENFKNNLKSPKLATKNSLKEKFGDNDLDNISGLKFKSVTKTREKIVKNQETPKKLSGIRIKNFEKILDSKNFQKPESNRIITHLKKNI